MTDHLHPPVEFASCPQRFARVGVEAVDHDEQWLEVVYTDGTTGRFFGSWLRDNVMSGHHREGGQRTFDLNTFRR